MNVARGGHVRPYVHAKLVSVDGRVTSIGSANLDATASFWESEANIVVQDTEFASGVRMLAKYFQRGMPPSRGRPPRSPTCAWCGARTAASASSVGA